MRLLRRGFSYFQLGTGFFDGTQVWHKSFCDRIL